MKRIRVRFNLSRGVNWKKWKIDYANGEREYLSPNDVQLVLHNCTLKNQKTAAKKIFEGAPKIVCAWILCDKIEIIKENKNIENKDDVINIRFNPRIAPHWIYDNDENIIVDGGFFRKIFTIENKLYIKK
jgi:hypothetical protein